MSHVWSVDSLKCTVLATHHFPECMGGCDEEIYNFSLLKSKKLPSFLEEVSWKLLEKVVFWKSFSWKLFMFLEDKVSWKKFFLETSEEETLEKKSFWKKIFKFFGAKVSWS